MPAQTNQVAQAEEMLRNYYAARAEEYDRIYERPERQADLRKLEAQIPSLLANKWVLEIACGTGYWTHIYAPEATSVIATDISDEVLDIARGRKEGANVNFVKADAYNLPKSLGTFDAVFAGFWYSHVPRAKIRGFLERLHAHLEPESLVVFLDNLYVEGSSTPLHRRDEDGNTYQLRPLQDGTEHCVLKNFPTAEDLHASIGGIGYTPHLRVYDYYWMFSYRVKK